MLKPVLLLAHCKGDKISFLPVESLNNKAHTQRLPAVAHGYHVKGYGLTPYLPALIGDLSESRVRGSGDRWSHPAGGGGGGGGVVRPY